MSALVLAGCGGDEESTNSVTTDAAGVEVTSADDGSALEITDVWARTSPMMTSLGAVYMTIQSAEGDEVLSAAVDASIAAEAQIHETMTSGGMSGDSMPMDTSGGMSGQMTMQEVDSLVIPAGESVELMPGGYHIMLMDLAAPLEVGQTFELTLTFAVAGDVVVTVEVRDDAP
ncbi:MAG: copper chaperone PCu(A)C [Ilumatobacteraceae bacterium]